MQEFTHVIADAAGLHARPVTQVVAAAMAWQSAVSVSCRGRSAAGTDLMGLMGLDARCGDELAVHVEGPDEDEAAKALRAVFSF